MSVQCSAGIIYTGFLIFVAFFAGSMKERTHTHTQRNRVIPEKNSYSIVQYPKEKRKKPEQGKAV